MFQTIRHTQELMAWLGQGQVQEFTMLEGETEEFSLSDYSAQYDMARGKYLDAAKALKMATGPYKASRDAYVAAASAYTKSLYD